MKNYLVGKIGFVFLKSLSIICMHRLYCTCKPQPTPEPPKQCQDLEGKTCARGMDEMCGENGICIPNYG